MVSYPGIVYTLTQRRRESTGIFELGETARGNIMIKVALTLIGAYRRRIGRWRYLLAYEAA